MLNGRKETRESRLMGTIDAVLQDDDERPGSEKIRLLSGGEIFFHDEISRGWASQRNETNIFRDGSRRSRWEDRFYSGLNPAIYSVLSRQQRQQQRRRWWRSCTVMLLFSPPSFSTSPSRFLRPFYSFFFLSFLPAISPPVSVLSRVAYTAGEVLSWK